MDHCKLSLYITLELVYILKAGDVQGRSCHKLSEMAQKCIRYRFRYRYSLWRVKPNLPTAEKKSLSVLDRRMRRKEKKRKEKRKAVRVHMYPTPPSLLPTIRHAIMGRKSRNGFGPRRCPSLKKIDDKKRAKVGPSRTEEGINRLVLGTGTRAVPKEKRAHGRTLMSLKKKTHSGWSVRLRLEKEGGGFGGRGAAMGVKKYVPVVIVHERKKRKPNKQPGRMRLGGES